MQELLFPDYACIALLTRFDTQPTAYPAQNQMDSPPVMAHSSFSANSSNPWRNSPFQFFFISKKLMTPTLCNTHGFRNSHRIAK